MNQRQLMSPHPRLACDPARQRDELADHGTQACGVPLVAVEAAEEFAMEALECPEVQIVGGQAARATPDKLDRIEFRAVGRQEEELDPLGVLRSSSPTQPASRRLSTRATRTSTSTASTSRTGKARNRSLVLPDGTKITMPTTTLATCLPETLPLRQGTRNRISTPHIGC